MTEELEDGEPGDCTFELKGGFGTIELKTARLHLRPPGKADVPEIAQLCNNREISEMTARIPYPYGIEDARAWIAETSQLSLKGREFALAIHDIKAQNLIGVLGAVAVEEGRFSVGYWIGEPHWGKGYATEAVRAMIDFLFNDLDAEAIISNVRVINRSSRSVLEKCGFQRMGSGMYRSERILTAVPIENYQLERRIWKSLKEWGHE